MMTSSKFTLGNGSTVEVTRKEGVSDAVWNDVFKFVKENDAAVQKHPQIAKILSEHPEQVPFLLRFMNDSVAMKEFLQSQVLAASMQAQENQDEKWKQLEQDPQLKPIADDIRTNGPNVIMKYLRDKKLCLKMSQKVGGISPEMLKQLKTIEDAGVSLHDAAKKSELTRIQEFIKGGKDVNARDLKGVTPLGYAVGHDQLSAVRMLMDAKANPDDVDNSGNSAVHFAAAYGRVKVLEHLLARGAAASKVNQEGMTPLAAARRNNSAAVLGILQRHGAR